MSSSSTITRKSTLLIASALALLLGAGILAFRPARLSASMECPNTDCFGAHLCDFLQESQCKLSGSTCTVSDCEPQ
jgi:hypothetical protein